MVISVVPVAAVAGGAPVGADRFIRSVDAGSVSGSGPGSCSNTGFVCGFCPRNKAEQSHAPFYNAREEEGEQNSKSGHLDAIQGPAVRLQF